MAHLPRYVNLPLRVVCLWKNRTGNSFLHVMQFFVFSFTVFNVIKRITYAVFYLLRVC
jgi:hypothetical protein